MSEKNRHTAQASAEENADVKTRKKSAAVSHKLNENKEKDKQREKAAYVKENIQGSTNAPHYENYENAEEHLSSGQRNEDNYSHSSDTADNAEKSRSREKFSDNVSSEQQKQIPPEMQQRMKRAAYIKETAENDIAVSRSFSADEETEEEKQNGISENTAAAEKSDPEKEKTEFTSRYLGNSEHVSENQYNDKRKNAAVRNAYEKEILKTQMNRRQNAIAMNSQLETNAALTAADRAKAAADRNAAVQEGIRDNVVSAAEFAAGEIEAVKSGDAARIAAQPAVNILRKSLGENTIQAADDISLISGTVKNSDSIGGAAANIGTTLAASEFKKAAKEMYRNAPDIQDRLENKYRYIDRKTDKKLSSVQSEKSEAMNGNIGKELEEKLNKIERKQDKYKEKLAKQQKDIQRRQQKSIYIKHNRDNPSFMPNVSKSSNRSILFKKKKTAVIGGVVSASIPVFAIFIVILIIAALFSWLNPFKFFLTGEENEKTAETEEEILDSYILEIQNYMDAAMTQCYLTYGTYCSATYGWDALIPDWGGYYEKFVKPQIDEVTESIRESYRESFAAAGKAGNSAELSRLGEAMSKQISEAISKIIEDALEAYQEILDDMNDVYGEPQEGVQILHFDPPANSQREHTETAGGKNDVWDVGEYNGKTCDGTNQFSLQSLNFDTDMSAEDMFILLALSRALSVMNNETADAADTAGTAETDITEADGNAETTAAKKKNEFAEITPDEINEFFEKTGFIQIEAHTEKGTCNGMCRRKLTGDWDSGWNVVYYCSDPDKPYEEPRHNVLTGSITIKSKEEMIETVMEKYNAEGAGVTRKDCDDIMKSYQKYIDDTLGEGSSRLFGKNDTSRAESFYYSEIGGNVVPNMGIWKIDTPLETDKNKEVTEDEKADNQTV